MTEKEWRLLLLKLLFIVASALLDANTDKYREMLRKMDLPKKLDEAERDL